MWEVGVVRTWLHTVGQARQQGLRCHKPRPRRKQREGNGVQRCRMGQVPTDWEVKYGCLYRRSRVPWESQALSVYSQVV